MKPKITIFDTGMIDNVNNNLNKLLSQDYDCEIFYLYENYRKFETTLFFIKVIRIIIELFRICIYLVKVKPNKIIIRGGGLNYYFYIPFLAKFIEKNIEIILFKYDIDNFRDYSNSIYSNLFLFFNKLSEKYCLLKANKIIHKGIIEELEFLPFYQKIKNTPHYLFREFLDQDACIKNQNLTLKLSAKDQKWHFCYGGCIHERDDFYHERTTNLFKRLINREIHVHVYARKAKDFEILEDNKYFHYEGFFSYKQLLKEYEKYDFGLYLYGRLDNKFSVDNIWDKTGFSNKIFDYITAGIPILYSDNLRAVSEFLDHYKLGIKLNYQNLNLDNIYNFNLEEYYNNRKKYLEQYSCQDFINFMEAKPNEK